MAENQEMVFRLFGDIAGEMQIEDIPLAPGVNIVELTKGDTEPLQVIVEVPASKSKRGWQYKSQSLKDIVDTVMTRTLNGFLGHQKPEDVSNQFLPPVTHWVGAKMVGESAFFRGVIDSAAPDLKRWIRSKRITQVSIFGSPKIERVGGETNVVGYAPLSIDWTPLDRAGMTTRIVAMTGEMWDSEGLGPNSERGVEGKVEWAEVITELKKRHGDKLITVGMLAGEMGLTNDQVVAELTPEFAKQVQRALDIAKEAQTILGVTGEMNIVDLFKSLKAAADEQAGAGFQKLVGEMVDSKVTSVAMKKDLINPETPLGKLWSYHHRGLKPDMSKEQIAGEVDAFLADTAVKGMISKYHTDRPAGFSGTSITGEQTTLKEKRVSI